MQLNGGNYGGWIFNQEELTITQLHTGEQMSCKLVDNIIQPSAEDQIVIDHIVQIKDDAGVWQYSTHRHIKSSTADFVGMEIL